MPFGRPVVPDEYTITPRPRAIGPVCTGDAALRTSS